jgi:hypothetical protein
MIKELRKNDKYERLTIAELSRKKGTRGEKYYECKCECGAKVTVSMRHLISGHTKSCGCYLRERSIENGRKGTHHKSKTKLFRIWTGMQTRCFNPNHEQYHNYGGRGISICTEWLGKEGFEKFYNWAVSNGYAEGLTIERMDVDGNYEPTNCTWITSREQQLNRRDTVFIAYNGKTQPLKRWAEELGVLYITLYWRYKHSGWPLEKIMSKKG